MDKLLITVAEAIQIGFGPAERQDKSFVSLTEIMVAQDRFIKPVLGKLWGEIDGQQYNDFVREYLKLPLALFVKSLAMRKAALQVGAMGVVKNNGDNFAPATDIALNTAIKIVKADARGLLRKAVEYIEANPENFPAYDPKDNVWNKVKLSGNVVI